MCYHSDVAQTRGTKALAAAKVAYELHRYEHREKGAVAAAAALGLPLERFAKTLVVAIDGEAAFVLMPGDRELWTRRLAEVADAKAATMVDPAVAERLTGYLTGGISPFGSRRALPVWIDERLLRFERIAVNAGQRGLIVELDPKDVVRLLGARAADLAAG